MITLKNLTLRRGANVLLEDVNWTIFHKQHIGIIGNNGSGKSTLFALILGQFSADRGEVEIPQHITIAHVAQETPALQQAAHEFVLDGDKELRQLQHDLTIAEQKNHGEEIAHLHARFADIDGYRANARAAKLLDGLGFSSSEQQKLVSDFSGGWRMRLNIAQALMCRSDVLLLDEPTNHLDLDAVIWLEQWLHDYPGTLLLISHDREFLDNTVDHIANLEHLNLKIYAGNYSSFETQRANALALQQATYAKQQKHVAHLQSFVDRFRYKASKARQAQSRLKAIERIELVSAVQVESPFQFEFREPTPCAYPLIRIDEGCIAYGKKTVLDKINLRIAPDDRIALLGPNGAGKSSLIKMLAGELALQHGERECSSGLKIGYFAQHQVDHLQLHESPLTHLKKLAENTPEKQLRSFLGGFDFSGDRVLEAVQNFSGGEKSRLALALLIWQKPNLLLLDEPTNHLDIEMRQALCLALQSYTGAMIIVSHDRFLIRTTADQLYLVAEGEVKDFAGDVKDYQEWLFKFRKQAEQPDETINEKPRKLQRQLEAQEREKRRPLQQKIKQLETALEKLEKELVALELILADQTLYQEENKTQLQENLQKQTQLKKQLQATEKEWLQASNELENM